MNVVDQQLALGLKRAVHRCPMNAQVDAHVPTNFVEQAGNRCRRQGSGYPCGLWWIRHSAPDKKVCVAA